VFKKRITDSTSQSAGLSIFLFILNSHWSCLNDAVGAKLNWNVANGRLRSSNFESARSVGLRERYAQTVFTFWTTLVCSRAVVGQFLTCTKQQIRWQFHTFYVISDWVYCSFVVKDASDSL
jgi:hypothetical protein